MRADYCFVGCVEPGEAASRTSTFQIAHSPPRETFKAGDCFLQPTGFEIDLRALQEKPPAFRGANFLLFRKDRSKSEIYNDLNGDLVNLFSVLRDGEPEFAAKL